ncbi:helix-turn-helix transcriptional regulator [Pannus brasiliensis CCIBt3594]|uniref:Helix-turn-helix transcriptional regulator n=1 Tax=Pannus brasiliensis CCIBt3594 TaxID=1427578 RepID=A0AAW9QIP8_9CHRO
MEDRKIRLQKMLAELAKNYSSESELARAMGIPRQAFGTYARAESFPQGENLQKIANFLNLSIDELMGQLWEKERSLKTKEKGATYQVNSNKAEDLIPIAAQLPNSEKLALVKYLVNSLDVAVS